MPKRIVDPYPSIRYKGLELLVTLSCETSYRDAYLKRILPRMRVAASFALMRPYEKLRIADTIYMDLGFKNSSLESGTLHSPLWVSLAAIAFLFLIFVADWITPATVVIGMAYQAPVVFSGLRGTPRLTMQVTALGVISLAIGWFMDLAADSYHFSTDRIENRLLSVISLLIVSFLSLRAQRANPNVA